MAERGQRGRQDRRRVEAGLRILFGRRGVVDEAVGQDHRPYLQAMIEQQGTGVIIWLDQEGRGNGHLALLRSRALQAQGLSQTEAYVQLGYAADARQYASAAAILQDLGVTSVVLMSNSPHKTGSLRAAGITITGTLPLVLEAEAGDRLRGFYADKIAQGHRIDLRQAQ